MTARDGDTKPPTTGRAATVKKTSAKRAPAKKAATRKPAARKKVEAPEVGTDEAATIPDAPDRRSVTSVDDLAAERAVDAVEGEAGAWDDDLWGGDWDDPGAFTADPGHPQRSSDQADGARRLAGDGAEMFQHAALELIAAARNALDAAEELVSDPGAVGTVLESFKDIAAELLRSGRPASGRRPVSDPPEGRADFQSIRVDDD